MDLARIPGVLALVLAVAACSAIVDPGGPPAPGDTELTSPLDRVVVLYDLTGDDLPDLVTLDRTADPFVVAEALVATDGGDSVDRTAELKGQPIDPEVSRVLASFLAESAEVASEARLDVTESGGRVTTVTVYE